MSKHIIQRYRTDLASPEIEQHNVVFARGAGNQNYIDDGYDDMYDGGNILRTDLMPDEESEDSGIPYTHTQVDGSAEFSDFLMDGSIADGTDYFGAGSQYFTNMYPGMFLLAARGINIDSFHTSGNLGADGSGDSYTGSFQVGSYTCYYRVVWDGSNGGDPCVNHLFIIPGDGTGVTHSEDSSTDNDVHTLEGLTGLHEFYYVLWSTNSYGFTPHYPSEEQCIELANQIVDGIETETLPDVLTYFNDNWQYIVTSIENSLVFFDDGNAQQDLYAMVYVGLQDGSRNAKYLAVSEQATFMGTAADDLTVTFTKVQDISVPVTSLAVFNGYVYGVCPWLPFLIKFSTDGEVVNEVVDEKFDTVLWRDGYGPMTLETLTATGEGLVGTYQADVYSVNPNGQCTLLWTNTELDNKTYDDLCGVGPNPPLMNYWFVSSEDFFTLHYAGSVNTSNIEVQWNPIGYSSHLDPPTSGWETATFEAQEDGIHITSPLVHEITDISFRVRYVEPNSMWTYCYWD